MHRQGSNESSQNGAGPYGYFAQPANISNHVPSNNSYANPNAPAIGSMGPYPVAYPPMPNNGYYGAYAQNQNPRSSAFMNSPVHHGNGGYGAARQSSPPGQSNGHLIEALHGLSMSDRRG